MFSLDATEEQLDFPTIYGSAKQGWMSEDWKEPKEDIAAVLDAIIKYIPEPKMLEGTPQMLITSLDYSKYVGRIAVGRVHRGELKEGQDVMLCKRDGSMVNRGSRKWMYLRAWDVRKLIPCSPGIFALLSVSMVSRSVRQSPT